MSQKATAKGPVLFFTSDGLLIQIPLDKVQLDNGTASTTFPNATAKLKEWLQALVDRGEISAAETDPPPAALTVEAATSGVEGNNVEIEVKPSVADANKVDVRVRKVDTYGGLTRDTIEAVLGTVAAPVLTNVGLLCVETNDAGAPDPTNRAVPVNAGAGAKTWTIAGGAAAPRVRLQAKREGDGFDAAHFIVAISAATVGAGGAQGTFTLTVTWAPPPVTNLEMAGIPAQLEAAFKYLVKFKAPSTGFKVPAPVTTTLAGGREKLDAVPASANVLAKP